MKYWEIMAGDLSKAGWSWGYCSVVTRDGWRWIVGAHREGRRYIVHSDELLSAFLELDRDCCDFCTAPMRNTSITCSATGSDLCL